MKIYDYNKKTFKRVCDEDNNYFYYIKLNGDYIEVSKEVYLVCLRSYEKIKYERKREVARYVQYFEDIDQATSFIFENNNNDFLNLIYIKNLAHLAIEEIYKLPDKYRDIAIALFLEELSERDVANKLGIPKSTVHKRKDKIQKILQKKIKKVGSY